MPETEIISKPCAWCQKELGEPPRLGESQGICDYHREQVEREAKERHVSEGGAE